MKRHFFLTPFVAFLWAVTTITTFSSRLAFAQAPEIKIVRASETKLACAADTVGTHVAMLSVLAVGGTGPLSYYWTASEGSVTDKTGPNAAFNTSSVTFDGEREGQPKHVDITMTVADSTGKSVSKSLRIDVYCPSKAARLSDVVFPKNSAHLNNCAKSYLDVMSARLLDGNYNLILVGHRDIDERETRPPLDEARIRSTAAYFKTCKNVDPNILRIGWVGTEQASTPDPYLCQDINESPDLKATSDDRNRRVELYLNARGAELPPRLAGLHVDQVPTDLPRFPSCP